MANQDRSHLKRTPGMRMGKNGPEKTTLLKNPNKDAGAPVRSGAAAQAAGLGNASGLRYDPRRSIEQDTKALGVALGTEVKNGRMRSTETADVANTEFPGGEVIEVGMTRKSGASDEAFRADMNKAQSMLDSMNNRGEGVSLSEQKFVGRVYEKATLDNFVVASA